MEETNVQTEVNVQTVTTPDRTAALMAEIERLKQEIKEAKDLRRRGVSLKVSEKGALSIYGLGRFPVTLYKSQIQTLGELFADGTIGKFVTDHTTEPGKAWSPGMLKERADKE